MSRNLIFLLVFGITFSAYGENANTNKSLPASLEIIYPHGVRSVSIVLSLKSSDLKVDYLTTEKKQYKVIKILSSTDSKMILKDWESIPHLLDKYQTELNCDLSQMWVVKLNSREKKVFCRNDKVISFLADIQQKIQELLL